jgi:D-alanyl-D-alanine carboxypeptidase
VEQPAPNADGRNAQSFNLASASSVPVRLDPPTTATVPRLAPGSTDPIQPVLVKTLNIKAGGAVRTASVAPLPFAGLPKPFPPNTDTVQAAPAKPEPLVRAGTRPAATPTVRTASVAAVESTPTPAAAPPKAPTHSGWMIQVGAYPNETEAKQRLAAVKSKVAHLLATADPLTESVRKGSTTYYRARFAVLGKEQAEAACKYLKRNDVDCLTIKN